MSINAVYEDSQGNVHESRMDGVDPTTKFSIADDFSTLVNYAVGDFCYHLGTLYKCTTAHTAGAWDSTHFTSTQVGDEIGELKNTLSGLTTGAFGTGVDIASYNNSSSAYTAPNDGYVKIKTASTVVGAGYNVYVIASNSTNIYDLVKICKNINGQVPERDFFFVKKGMKIWVQVAGAIYDQECIYYPLV